MPSLKKRPWWRDAVTYQVYVRSFADSDGDGVGDLPGVRSRLPYLADLGVDAVWLTPFYLSPMADGGYDVADHRAVDPMYGDLDDIDTLIKDAHGLGLKVVIDVVPNHTSDQHRWFVEDLEHLGDPSYRSRYVFRRGRGDGSEPPTNWLSVFGGPAWQHVRDGWWYLHLFAPEQPDLDWDHPQVRADFLELLRFWLDRGVDGVRIDVAHALIKDLEPLRDLEDPAEDPLEAIGGEGHPFWDLDGVHEIYRSWHDVLASYPGDRMAVAEAWVASPERRSRYVRADELHQAFNFDVVKASWSAAALHDAIDGEIAMTSRVGATPTWVLSNHDVQRPVTRFGDGDVGMRRARAAAMLMLALPGAAYVYQGEELGLPEVLDLPDEVLQDPVFLRTGGAARGRDGCRVPLPWTGKDAPLGFGPAGSTPWLPQPVGWASLTVEAQTDDPASTLELYRDALVVRRQLAATAPLQWRDCGPDVIAFDRGDHSCVVNLGSSPVRVGDEMGAVVLRSDPVSGRSREVAPDTAVWLARGPA